MMNLFIQSPALSAVVSEHSAAQQALSSAITALIVLLVLVAAIAVVLEIMRMRARRSSKKRMLRTLTIPVYLVAVLVLVFTIFCGNRLNNLDGIHVETPAGSTGGSTNDSSFASSVPVTSLPPVTTLPSQPATQPEPSFPSAPHSTDKSNPANWNIKWEINSNGSFVDSYQRNESISFGQGDKYFKLPGVAGFRGNNYRDNATYGTVNVVNKELTEVWQREISALPKANPKTVNPSI